MDTIRAGIRLPIVFLVVAILLIAAGVGYYTSQAADLGKAVQTDLTNHKDNQDRAPAEQACEARGGYGSVEEDDAPGPHTECEEKPPSGAGNHGGNSEGHRKNS